MNYEEIMNLVKELRRQFKATNKGKSEEEIDEMILDVFFQAFVQDKMDKEDLKTLSNALGYEINEDVIKEVEQEKRNRR